MKPFLKWAGNKYAIISRIQSVLPPEGRLIEPFAGSAAVFLNTNYQSALLSDINPHLIELYRYLKKDGNQFIGYCSTFFVPETNNPETYYQFREIFNSTGDMRLKSALFLYFNRHGYNGLCRYNAKGEFNVPFGRYTKPYFPREEMADFHLKIQSAELACQDFTTSMKTARPGDVIYCDPPYVPLTATANFTGYSRGGFGPEEQQQLADLAGTLAKKGVTVVISNHDTIFTQNAYSSARIISFQVRRYISCKGDARGQANEMLALFGTDGESMVG
ncbi:MAG TPA: Dam family site-specific DNA-(adenine-N6)-methyltransferase [Coleofasciculaceae cyanobacterium]|jgi:DNA adenine methylase